jgi:putative heme iron utilization protein
MMVVPYLRTARFQITCKKRSVGAIFQRVYVARGGGMATSTPDLSALEREYEAACVASVNECKRLNYNPKIFVRMMSEHGAREATRRLLRGSEIPQGLYTLAEIGRLDLSLEAFIRDNARFQALFADEPRILANCISRLQLLGYS